MKWVLLLGVFAGLARSRSSKEGESQYARGEGGRLLRDKGLSAKDGGDFSAHC